VERILSLDVNAMPVPHDSGPQIGQYWRRSHRPVSFEFQDLATIGLLIALEGLLSADNALVMAIMVLGLPRHQHHKALRYGLIGGFAFRTAATLLAAYLIAVAWVKLLGGLYLLYLSVVHFKNRTSGAHGGAPPKALPAFGLSAFWATVVRVELVNLAFSIDSILVAVAMSRKTWVVVLGGILGIVAMRIVAGQLIELIRRYPAIVDGAFVIIAWVGFKLLAEYAHQLHWIAWEIPKSLSLGLIAVIFVVSYLYARSRGPEPPEAPLPDA
jgi:YkoY family integral membrane protein